MLSILIETPLRKITTIITTTNSIRLTNTTTNKFSCESFTHISINTHHHQAGLESRAKENLSKRKIIFKKAYIVDRQIPFYLS